MSSYDYGQQKAAAQEPVYLTALATIGKDLVAVYCKHDPDYRDAQGKPHERDERNVSGYLNAKPFVLGDREYPALSLSFEGFAGVGRDGAFVGEFRFLPFSGDPVGKRSFDFADLWLENGPTGAGEVSAPEQTVSEEAVSEETHEQADG